MSLTFIIWYTFLFAAGCQALFYVMFFRFAWSRSKKESNKELPPVSVIVMGRNEKENFKNFLPKICNQNYPEFEVLAVNDQSIDDSKEVIEALVHQYPQLRLVNVEENERFWLGKKYGLTLGIKAAAHEHLLFIDADCYPDSENWIKEMSAEFDRKELILGYGAYEFRPTLLNLFIQFETVHTAIQYFSMALLGMPYMGVGRNLGYSRPLFFKKKGFASHMHIPSGDDDLFVQDAGNRKNVSTIYSKDAHTRSVPKENFKEWIRQKQRHFNTSKYYKPFYRKLLGLYGASQILFYLSLFIWWGVSGGTQLFWIFLGAKLLFQFLVFLPATYKLGSMRILWVLPFLELFTLVFHTFALASSRFNKKKRW